ncbi:hypothetical protein BDK51DRAFT_34116 [Blyttiomyces helicus]|uniref:Uncharacterized protein n=1 Tax=Blyttiomyces helicus TaxID=388810 RepID=A0A4P9WBH6_9FUNG|nr:hypothetical protein BDK51DRAFT_34116 [Blyttiomyces helicus]|eukprot:RKO88903.1 hypothetical protein BDK51DRAFT_34116 [Blyttiomyces helicus]
MLGDEIVAQKLLVAVAYLFSAEVAGGRGGYDIFMRDRSGGVCTSPPHQQLLRLPAGSIHLAKKHAIQGRRVLSLARSRSWPPLRGIGIRQASHTHPIRYFQSRSSTADGQQTADPFLSISTGILWTGTTSNTNITELCSEVQIGGLPILSLHVSLPLSSQYKRVKRPNRHQRVPFEEKQ